MTRYLNKREASSMREHPGFWVSLKAVNRGLLATATGEAWKSFRGWEFQRRHGLGARTRAGRREQKKVKFGVDNGGRFHYNADELYADTCSVVRRSGEVLWVL
jgi:hypothetical protein